MATGEEQNPAHHGEGFIEYVVDSAIPADPYNWRLLQFGMLGQMGYPVVIEDVPLEQARQEREDTDPRLEPFYLYQLERFKRAFLPGVLDPNFVEWTDDLSGREFPDLRVREQQSIWRHPGILLPRAVDDGDFKVVGRYLGQIREERPIMSRHANYGGVFRSCYISAMDRLVERARVAPFYLTRPSEIGRPTARDIALYQNFQSSKVQPVSPEALGSLMQDYYRLLGSLVPQFASFKRA